MAASDGVVLTKVVPSLGCIIANMMFASPMLAVIRVRRERKLGDLNPLPMALMTAATLACTVYACVISDIFLFCTNLPGLLMAVFYTAACTPYASHKMQELMMLVYLAMTALVGAVAFADMLGVQGQAMKTLWGAMLVALLALYYTAPLSTIAHVLRTRCSATLHWPLCLMNGVNGALWTAYGVAIKDWYVAGPQAFGAVASAVALLLCLVYPREVAGGAEQQQQQQQQHKDDPPGIKC